MSAKGKAEQENPSERDRWAAEHSGDVRKDLENGNKIIITTVQKFPEI